MVRGTSARFQVHQQVGSSGHQAGIGCVPRHALRGFLQGVRLMEFDISQKHGFSSLGLNRWSVVMELTAETSNASMSPLVKRYFRTSVRFGEFLFNGNLRFQLYLYTEPYGNRPSLVSISDCHGCG